MYKIKKRDVKLEKELIKKYPLLNPATVRKNIWLLKQGIKKRG